MFMTPELRNKVSGGMYVYVSSSVTGIDDDAFDLIVYAASHLKPNGDSSELQVDYKEIAAHIIDFSVTRETYHFVKV